MQLCRRLHTLSDNTVRCQRSFIGHLRQERLNTLLINLPVEAPPRQLKSTHVIVA